MKLEKWKFVKIDDLPVYAKGFVYGNRKFKDGTYISTSLIRHYDKENKIIETINSVYELGEEDEQ